MFDNQHHRYIHTILCSLNPQFFIRASAYFGGGTLIALLHQEYRWSKDIDFVCPAGEGYRYIRGALNQSNGYDAIFSDVSKVKLPRSMTADQYGIRFPVIVGDVIIKFEIFLESRIKLGQPEYFDWCLLPCLNVVDRFAEKLLSNADRWPDKSFEARDLIDLCVLRSSQKVPNEAIEKAEDAYSVLEPLKKAIVQFQDDSAFRHRCFSSLQLKDPAMIIDGLDLLAEDYGLAKTKRIVGEARPDQYAHLVSD